MQPELQRPGPHLPRHLPLIGARLQPGEAAVPPWQWFHPWVRQVLGMPSVVAVVEMVAVAVAVAALGVQGITWVGLADPAVGHGLACISTWTLPNPERRTASQRVRALPAATCVLSSSLLAAAWMRRGRGCWWCVSVV